MTRFTVVGVYPAAHAGAVFFIEAEDAVAACSEARKQSGDGFEVVAAFEGHLNDESGEQSDWP